MPKITIDGADYHSEDLSEKGKSQLESLQFLEGQMKKIEHEIAIYQTAKTAYSNALKGEIERLGLKPVTD